MPYRNPLYGRQHPFPNSGASVKVKLLSSIISPSFGPRTHELRVQMSRRITVFFYGLFMDVDLLLSKGAHPTHPRSACVPGFALRIGQRATLIPNAESSAHGIIMELSHAEIEQLYSEASVSAYRPEAVLAQLADGSCSPALCFNLVVPPAPEEANSDYAMKLRELARRLKLPPGYVESIR